MYIYNGELNILTIFFVFITVVLTVSELIISFLCNVAVSPIAKYRCDS